jgi:hypothetical protein
MPYTHAAVSKDEKGRLQFAKIQVVPNHPNKADIMSNWGYLAGKRGFSPNFIFLLSATTLCYETNE